MAARLFGLLQTNGRQRPVYGAARTHGGHPAGTGQGRAASAFVSLLGPQPRFYVDRLLRSEAMAAYHLGRQLKQAARPGRFAPWGRALKKKLACRHVVVEDAHQWFAEDGIRLSREGYRKVAGVALFPRWMCVD